MTHLDFDLSTLSVTFAERIAESPDGDLVREMVTFLHQAPIDVEASDAIGAERHERVLTRTTRRNGSRQRRLSTKAGDIDLKRVCPGLVDS